VRRGQPQIRSSGAVSPGTRSDLLQERCELLPNPIRELVLDDERLRNEICGACSTVDDLAFVVRHRGRRG
jgi:hypothetical protein